MSVQDCCASCSAPPSSSSPSASRARAVAEPSTPSQAFSIIDQNRLSSMSLQWDYVVIGSTRPSVDPRPEFRHLRSRHFELLAHEVRDRHPVPPDHAVIVFRQLGKLGLHPL